MARIESDFGRWGCRFCKTASQKLQEDVSTGKDISMGEDGDFVRKAVKTGASRNPTFMYRNPTFLNRILKIPNSLENRVYNDAPLFGKEDRVGCCCLRGL